VGSGASHPKERTVYAERIAERRRALARTLALLRLERRLARERNDKVAELLAERAIRAVQTSWRHLRECGVI